jgi:hypothetical protein
MGWGRSRTAGLYVRLLRRWRWNVPAWNIGSRGRSNSSPLLGRRSIDLPLRTLLCLPWWCLARWSATIFPQQFLSAVILCGFLEIGDLLLPLFL